MNTRKIITALALAVGGATTVLATPASALAAEAHPHTAVVTPKDCSNPGWNDGEVYVAITDCDGSATAIGAQTNVDFYGYIELYGPDGDIADSPVQQYYNGNYVTYAIDPSEAAPSGSLWCAKLWVWNGSSWYVMDNNCVTI